VGDPRDDRPTPADPRLRPPEPSRSDHTDAVVPVTVGTIAWAVALVVVLSLRGTLDAHDSGWWIWVCVTGLLLGLGGCWWVRRRRNRLNPVDPVDPVDRPPSVPG
jgi:Protein of unknown function (DUF2530)